MYNSQKKIKTSFMLDECNQLKNKEICKKLGYVNTIMEICNIE